MRTRIFPSHEKGSRVLYQGRNMLLSLTTHNLVLAAVTVTDPYRRNLKLFLDYQTDCFQNEAVDSLPFGVHLCGLCFR